MNRSMLGEVVLDVVDSESPTHSSQTTDKPVERGQDITDHVIIQPIKLTISGVVVGEEAPKKLEQLRDYRDNAELLTYVGRNLIHGVVIENLQTSHTAKVGDGFTFNITLKQIRISESQMVQVTIPPPAAAAQTNGVNNKGTQQAGSQEADDGKKSSTLFKLVGKAEEYLQKVGL